MAANINGQMPTPEQESETGPESVTSKARIMEYLKGSFAALHHAVAIVTKENILEALGSRRPPPQNNRLQFAMR